MSHDPLCPTFGKPSCTLASLPNYDCDSYGHLPPCGEFYCLCGPESFAARVRADEREAAAQRVLAVKWGWYDDTQQEATINRDDAVRAAFGGDES